MDVPDPAEEGADEECPSNSYLEEKDELLGIVSDTLSHVSRTGGAGQAEEFDRFLEDTAGKFARICKKYQEQPELLDPHLLSLVGPLISRVATEAKRQESEGRHSVQAVSLCCALLKVVATVRGPKVLSTLFPNTPRDFEPAVALLQSYISTRPSATAGLSPPGGAPAQHSLPQEAAGGSEYACSAMATHDVLFVVVLWLSLLALLPFDLSIVDSSAGLRGSEKLPGAFSDSSPEDPGGPPPPMALQQAAEIFLEASPKVLWLLRTCLGLVARDATYVPLAAHVLARLLSRRDMGQSASRLLQWAEKSTDFDAALGVGLAKVYAFYFKVATPAAGAAIAERCWAALGPPLEASRAQSGFLADKLRTKLVQRCALSLLLPASHVLPGREDSPLVEEAIGELLQAAASESTAVRWSAAKGLARIAERLEPDMAAQVLSAVMELPAPAEGDAVWHGACLALAEMARRSLIPTQELPALADLITKALVFEKLRGAHGIGAHVRNAAAYVCWALARAYPPSVLGPTVLPRLCPALVATACLDRDVSCRRAAAAAFQETVGRQGGRAVPHGIRIVTTADFAALGSLGHSVLNVALALARLPDYRKAILEGLKAKTCHWSEPVRLLAGEALSLAVPLDPQFAVGEALPFLVVHVSSPELRERHGAMCALGLLLPALRDALSRRELTGLLPGVTQAASSILPRSLYQGKNSDSSRIAACRFLSGLALAVRDWDRPAGVSTPHPPEDALLVSGGTTTTIEGEKGEGGEGVHLAVPGDLEEAVVEFLHWNLDLDSDAVQVAASRTLADCCLIQSPEVPGAGERPPEGCMPRAHQPLVQRGREGPHPLLVQREGNGREGPHPTLVQREREGLLRQLAGGASAHHVVGAARTLGELGARCALTVDAALVEGLCRAMLRKEDKAQKTSVHSRAAAAEALTRILARMELLSLETPHTPSDATVEGGSLDGFSLENGALPPTQQSVSQQVVPPQAAPQGLSLRAREAAHGGTLEAAVRDNVVPALLLALQDYTRGKKGDVGRLLREHAMRGLLHAAFLLWRLHCTRGDHAVGGQPEGGQVGGGGTVGVGNEGRTSWGGGHAVGEGVPGGLAPGMAEPSTAGTGSTVQRTTTAQSSAVRDSMIIPEQLQTPAEGVIASADGCSPHQMAKCGTAEPQAAASCCGHTTGSDDDSLERLLGSIVGGVAKQGVEKIARTREVAGRVLQALVWGRAGYPLGAEEASVLGATPSISATLAGRPLDSSPGARSSDATVGGSPPHGNSPGTPSTGITGSSFDSDSSGAAAPEAGGSGAPLTKSCTRGYEEKGARRGGLALALPAREILEEAIPRDDSFDWKVPKNTCPRMVLLLRAPAYRRPVLAGLAASISGLSLPDAKAAGDALCSLLQADLAAQNTRKGGEQGDCPLPSEGTVRAGTGGKKASDGTAHASKAGEQGHMAPAGSGGEQPSGGLVAGVFRVLESLLLKNQGRAEVVTSYFKTLSVLLEASSGDPPSPFLGPEYMPFWQSVMACAHRELWGEQALTTAKIDVVVGLLCHLCACAALRRAALSALLDCFALTFPTVRQHLTEQLYLVLLPFSMEEERESQEAEGEEEEGALSNESVEEALALISEGEWAEMGEDVVRQNVGRLRTLLLSKGS